TGVKTILPANACTVGPGAGQCDSAGGVADSVSCASAGNCVAVGDYTDNSGDDAGLLLTEREGRWRKGVEAQSGALISVSCTSRTHRSAVGYDDLLTETAGKWTGAFVVLPAKASPYPQLNSVSCALAGACSAVGLYTDLSGNYQGLLIDSTPLPCVVPKLN